MKNFFKRTISFLLVSLLLFPASVEFAHVFLGHKHEVCNHYSDSHFHEKNQDCSLFHFQKTSFSTPQFLSFSPVQLTVDKDIEVSFYNFLAEAEKPDFSRRGPPEVSVS